MPHHYVVIFICLDRVNEFFMWKDSCEIVSITFTRNMTEIRLLFFTVSPWLKFIILVFPLLPWSKMCTALIRDIHLAYLCVLVLNLQEYTNVMIVHVIVFFSVSVLLLFQGTNMMMKNINLNMLEMHAAHLISKQFYLDIQIVLFWYVCRAKVKTTMPPSKFHFSINTC